MTRNVMNGLPRALLTKWATPFDETTKNLQLFLPHPGSQPQRLTQQKCSQMHSIFCEGINHTEEIEEILAARIKALKRKHARSGNDKNDAVGWIKQQQQQQKKKKKDRARTSSGSAQSQQHKRKKRKDDKKSSSLLPAWVTRTPKTGDQIAAKESDGTLWILATVVKHIEKKGTFVVVDEDAGEGTRKEFKVRRSHMLALPRPEEASGAIFPVGIEVMALYPQTTTFYSANISAPFVPGKDGERDRCVVQFQGDDLTHEGKLRSHTLDARYVRYRAES